MVCFPTDSIGTFFAINPKLLRASQTTEIKQKAHGHKNKNKNYKHVAGFELPLFPQETLCRWAALQSEREKIKLDLPKEQPNLHDLSHEAKLHELACVASKLGKREPHIFAYLKNFVLNAYLPRRARFKAVPRPTQGIESACFTYCFVTGVVLNLL